VLTKFDIIDGKVDSAISMVYISGQPIVFVGTGQTYTDLNSINSCGRGRCAHEVIVYNCLVSALDTSCCTSSCIFIKSINIYL